jgi:hypothetical protein
MYMKVDDGVTTVTRGIDSSSTTATLRSQLLWWLEGTLKKL